jgi:predicted aspartyl protease
MMIKEWPEELAKRPREEQRKMITTTIKAGVLTGLLLAAASAQSATVELVQESGTYKVPVEINGVVRLPFTLDTGATNVVISTDVFRTLVRAGTISGSDYVGNGTATSADGSKRPFKLYRLREVKVGGFTIRNVDTSVSSEESPVPWT